MKKLFFIILNILLVFTLKSQVIQERLLQVNPANVAKFEAAVEKKLVKEPAVEEKPKSKGILSGIKSLFSKK